MVAMHIGLVSVPYQCLRYILSPILFLILPLADVITGSAEDSLCKLRVDLTTWEIKLVKRIKLKASGVSEIVIRQDGRIFAAAGWDHTIRVFSNKTCAPLAVLQVNFQAFLTHGRLYPLQKSGMI